MIATFISFRFISPLPILRKVFLANSYIKHKTFVTPSSFLLNSKTSHDPLDINMENLHREWTKEEDQLLYENRFQPLPRLASILGRGLRGIQARLDKLSDIDSLAYTRLFTHSPKDDTDTTDSESKRLKLSTASEVLHRIRWDQHLTPSDFSVLYFDRLEETILETAFDAANESVQSRQDFFVFAIPEHRIMVIPIFYLILSTTYMTLDFTQNMSLCRPLNIGKELSGIERNEWIVSLDPWVDKEKPSMV